MKTPFTLSLSTAIITSTLLNKISPLYGILLIPIVFILLAIIIYIVDNELTPIEKTVVFATLLIVHEMAKMIYS